MKSTDYIFELFGKFIECNKKGNFKERELAATADKFLNRIRECRDIINVPEDLEEVLRSCTAGKESYKEVILRFYDFYECETGILIESDLCEKEIIDDPRRRRIALLKYLQTHKCRTRQLAEHFMISEKTMNEDLHALESGVDILGTSIRADIMHKGWENYQENSCHPVLLNLSMTEVLALTVGLLDAAEKEPLYADSFRKIAYDTYRNLTDYGKYKMNSILENRGIHYFDEEVEMYENQLSLGLMTMWKSGCLGSLQIMEEGSNIPYQDCHVLDYIQGNLKILTRENEIKIIPVESVFSCEYYLKREFI